jgi:ABC-type Mn2+/Zn2+ transport system ATPase subunit
METSPKSEGIADGVVIRIDHGVIGYPGTWTLGPIDVAIRRGSFWGIVGPNGSGKSTLLRSIAGLAPLLSGSVHLSGAARRRGGISYVPQREALDPIFPVTAVGVVKMGLAPERGFARPFFLRHHRQALEALDRVGLRHLARSPFRQLSGGEQQRTLLARATVAHPAVLVLDEPTAAMDVDAERAILELLRELARAESLAVVVVSHTLPAIRTFADCAIRLDRECGTVEVGRPQEILGEEIPGGSHTLRRAGSQATGTERSEP